MYWLCHTFELNPPWVYMCCPNDIFKLKSYTLPLTILHLSKNKASSVVYLDFSLSCKPVLCAHKRQVTYTVVNKSSLGPVFYIWERHNLGSWGG